jgi:hypothetical protein
MSVQAFLAFAFFRDRFGISGLNGTRFSLKRKISSFESTERGLNSRPMIVSTSSPLELVHLFSPVANTFSNASVMITLGPMKKTQWLEN